MSINIYIFKKNKFLQDYQQKYETFSKLFNWYSLTILINLYLNWFFYTFYLKHILNIIVHSVKQIFMSNNFTYII